MLYLRDVSIKPFYTSDEKNIYCHKNIIWMFYYNINRIKSSPYLNIDGTLISTKEFLSTNHIYVI